MEYRQYGCVLVFVNEREQLEMKLNAVVEFMGLKSQIKTLVGSGEYFIHSSTL